MKYDKNNLSRFTFMVNIQVIFVYRMILKKNYICIALIIQIAKVHIVIRNHCNKNCACLIYNNNALYFCTAGMKFQQDGRHYGIKKLIKCGYRC